MPPTQLRHRAKGYQKITARLRLRSSLLDTPPSPTSCDSTTVPTVWCVFYASELKITTHRRLQIVEHAQAGQKQKSAHDSLHWSREGQDRTSTAALKKPNSYAISPVVTALCYLRTAVFSNAKLVPTQTSQRIANARTDHLKNSAYCRQPKQNVPHSAQDATRVACPPHIRLSETPEVC